MISLLLQDCIGDNDTPFDNIPDETLTIIFTFAMTGNVRRSQQYNHDIINDNNPYNILLTSKRFNNIMMKVYPELFRFRFRAHRFIDDYSTISNKPGDIFEEFKPDKINDLFRNKLRNKHEYIKIFYNNSASITIFMRAVTYYAGAELLTMSISTNISESIWVESSSGKFIRAKAVKWKKMREIIDHSIFDMHEQLLFSIFDEARKYFYSID